MNHPWTAALVTGASSGIGEAMARQLGAAGVATVAVARRGDRLDALAAEYACIEVLTADLQTEKGRAAVVARLSDPARPIDLLVNNAGFGVDGSFAETPIDRHLAMIELNVSALVTLSHAALQGMVARGRGWLLQVSSVVSFQAAPTSATYAATKAFVTNLTESLSEELRGTGVRVSALCPGATRTEFFDVSGSAAETSRLPAAAWMSADAVAAAGLAAMAAGRVIEVPGVLNKAWTAMSQALPRSLVRWTAGQVTRR